jgi:hypothetical protein
MNRPVVTIYWQPDSVWGVMAHLPNLGFDMFDSFDQLDCYCICEYFGTDIEYIQVRDEAHRQELARLGVFNDSF